MCAAGFSIVHVAHLIELHSSYCSLGNAKEGHVPFVKGLSRPWLRLLPSAIRHEIVARRRVAPNVETKAEADWEAIVHECESRLLTEIAYRAKKRNGASLGSLAPKQ